MRDPLIQAEHAAVMAKRWGDPIVRFWSHVDKGTDCWEWTGTRDNHGYGQAWWAGSRWKAHRISWTLAHGDIPPGRMVLHHCDNPPCVNPSHLFLGTQADNMRDKAEKGRAIGGPGAKFGSQHHGAKLTEDIVREARRRHAAGAKVGRLANEFGVSQSAMSNALSGRTWPKA